MYRVTKDTNILVSALNFPGLPFRLIELARTGAFRLQISEPILDEMIRVLQRQFDWTLQRAIHAGELLQSFSQQVTPHIELDVVKEDPDDNRILECAQASQSDYLVTRDKHLLRLGQGKAKDGGGGSEETPAGQYAAACDRLKLLHPARCALGSS